MKRVKLILSIVSLFFFILIFSGNKSNYNVIIILKDSNNNPLTTGSLRYYDGSWHEAITKSDGSFNINTTASSLTYEMTYEHGKQTKENIPVTLDSVVFQTVNVKIQLGNSSGILLDTGAVQYYAGGWFPFGTTTGGISTKELLPNNYTFRMTYEHGSIDKAQDIGSNNVVEFQTVEAEVHLVNSLGSLIDEGSVQYYAGGWFPFGTTTGGISTKELLPNNYTFRMTYEHGSIDKAQDIGSNNVVEFQTVKAEVHLVNSLGSLIDEGSVQYYAGGWFPFGTTTGGISTKELLPNNYTFRMTYEHGSIDKAQDIGSNNVVEFQTVKAEVHLVNSLDSLIDEGSVQYYAGGWFPFGTTTGGISTKELLPNNYTFRMTYEHGSIDKAQNIGTVSLIIFKTVKVIAQLKNENGTLIDPGTVTYYSGGWHSFGNTSSGLVSKELLPKNYTFKLVYNNNPQQKEQDVSVDTLVIFQTSGESPQPVLSITEPAEGTITRLDSIIVSGNVDNPGTTTITINGQNTTVQQDGSFSIKIALAEGNNTITVIAQNQSGNNSTVERNVTKDTTPPIISVNGFQDSSFTNQQQLNITGTAIGADMVIINSDSIAINQDGSFSRVVNITEGSNTINIFAVDNAGNTASKTLIITGDFQAPELWTAVFIGDPNDPNSQYLDASDTLQVKQQQIYVFGEVDGELEDITAIINQDTVPAIKYTWDNEIYFDFDKQINLSGGLNTYLLKAIDKAGNITEKYIYVILNKPILYINSPANNYSTDSAMVNITGSITNYTGTEQLFINDLQISLETNGSFNGKVSLMPGNNYIPIKAINKYGITTDLTLHIIRNYSTIIPPDPVKVAPPLDSTVATTMYTSTEFLYKGNKPIQYDVEDSVIKPERISVIKGKVLDNSNNPLSGVLITILDHPEYGYTFSRLDGKYDMAVNGGGYLNINYNKNGYLPVQRQANLPWQDYTIVDSVIMTKLDTNVTKIDFADSVEVARGSVEKDESGSRQATLMFKKGTSATMILPDGSTQQLSSLNVRATEYTVNDDGQAKMPAELPPTSAYTYCVELSADEAIQAGAEELEFDKPVSFYVNNFLNFPSGSIVPVGYYDRSQKEWIASDNGRVIKIENINKGLADVDINGDDIADPPDTLFKLGIDSAEREKLASLYSPGTTLWRIQVSHFSAWDGNWGAGVGSDAVNPDQKTDNIDKQTKDQCSLSGSIIGAQNQTLGEKYNMQGTSFNIYYNSGRMTGYKGNYTLRIPLTGNNIPGSLDRVILRITVAGRNYSYEFPKGTNLEYTFHWDGKDAYGREISSRVPVSVQIGYVYKAVYQEPVQINKTFALLSGVPYTANPTRREITLWQRWSSNLGQINLSGELGGWMPDIHHIYDPVEKTIYNGDGTFRRADAIDNIITKVAGTGEVGFSGDGGTALNAEFSGFAGNIAVDKNGNIYIADNNRIRKINTDGIIETIAGTGNYGYPTDGEIAKYADLNNIVGFLVAKDGSIYFSEYDNIVRKINKYGIISTFAGSTSDGGFGGDGGPAISAKLSFPTDIAEGPDGSIYICDAGNNRIRKVSTNGMITTVAGNGQRESAKDTTDDGGPATDAGLDLNFLSNWGWVFGSIAVGPDGNIYIGELNGRIRKVNTNGIITTIAGGKVYRGNVDLTDGYDQLAEMADHRKMHL